EEINEPERGRRIRQQKENRKRSEVGQQRKLPVAQMGNVFDQKEQKRRTEITEHEGNRVRAARLWRLFEQNSQGQHHKNRAGIGDLALEMPAFDTGWMHGIEGSFYSKPSAGGVPEGSGNCFPTC